MTQKKPPYRLKAPAFRLPRGTNPIFLTGNRIFHLGSTGGVVFDLGSRRRTHKIKTCSHPTNVAISDAGDWLATKNSSGEITTARLSDGTPLAKYKRPPYQDSGQLAPYNDKFFLDSADGAVHLHDIAHGQIARTYQYGNDGWMPEGVAYSKKLNQIIAGVTPKHGNPSRAQKLSLLHYFDIDKEGPPVNTVEVPNDLKRMSISPDGSRIALLYGQDNRDSIGLEIRTVTGNLLKSCKLPGREVYYGSPTWTNDGASVIVIFDRGRLVFVDCESMEITHTYQGPHLTGYACNTSTDMVALTGESSFGGIVLSRSELANWSEFEGQPRHQLLADQFYAYSLHVDLRKACPPRAALFIKNGNVIFESEKLTGYFRYVPGTVISTSRLSDDPLILGKLLRTTLEAFEESPGAKEPVFGPDFGGEQTYLESSGVEVDRLEFVRYLGHARRYSVDHSDVELMLVVAHHESRLHFWQCHSTEDGKFYEDCWPHYHEPHDSNDETLGKLLITAIEILPKKPKYSY